MCYHQQPGMNWRLLDWRCVQSNSCFEILPRRCSILLNGYFQILRNLLNGCISQFSSTLRSASCELRVFVWAVGSTHLSLQIESFRMKDDLKLTKFNNTKYIYTISFPNTTSELAFPLMRGDTWNFPRHILYPGKGMQLDEDHLLCHRRLLVIY